MFVQLLSISDVLFLCAMMASSQSREKTLHNYYTVLRCSYCQGISLHRAWLDFIGQSEFIMRTLKSQLTIIHLDIKPIYSTKAQFRLYIAPRPLITWKIQLTDILLD